jgi:hypothetical protein
MAKPSAKSLIPKRKRLDFNCARRPRTKEIDQAMGLVKTAGFAEKMERHLDRRIDARQALSVRGLEVAKALRGFEQGHSMLLIDICRIINTFDKTTLNLVGMPNWKPVGGYDRVERLTGLMAEALDDGFDDVDPDTGEITHIDLQWFIDAVTRAAVPPDLVAGCAIAVDGTDMPTWGALHGAEETVELDGEAALPVQLDGVEATTTTKKAKAKTIVRKTAKVFGIGDDGRKIYTKDTDARAGHRSATNQREAGPYVGRELHLGAAVPAMKWTNGTTNTTLGRTVPQVILTANVVPAGTHRGKATVASLLDAKQQGFCEEVLGDPGYSLVRQETFHLPLRTNDIPFVLRPASHQRTRPDAAATLGDAFVLDGQLFSKHTPEELRHLPVPARGTSGEDKKKYEKDFERRAAFAYVRHKKPNQDGITRWKCPFCAGKLRSRQLPHTMRNARKTPLIELPENSTRCCDGIISVGADQLPLMQETIFGTAAWSKSYGRRNIVESVNAALKGGFTTIERGYTRSLKTARIILGLAHTLAGYNRWTIKSWRKLQSHLAEENVKDKRKPRKNRLKRFDDIALATVAPGPEPPPTS